MRSLITAASLLALGFASCKKQEVIGNHPKTKPPFRISGLSDIRVERNPFNYQNDILSNIYLTVKYESGDQKRITLYIEDLPVGLQDSFTKRAGYPDFNTQVVLYDEGVPAGNYSATLVAKAEGDTVVISYPFTIAIKGDASCAKYYSGKVFSALNSCSANYPNPLVPYNASSFQLNETDTLVISNFKNDGNNLKILLNCFDGKIEVPTQIVDGKSTRGYGRLAVYAGTIPNVIVVNLTEVDAQGNVALCNYSFEVK